MNEKLNAKCVDCDAPAVRLSAPEYSAGVDTTPKPRCERHAHPVKMVPTVWCDTHQVTGAHIERADCTNPHYTHNYVPAPPKTLADYTPTETASVALDLAARYGGGLHLDAHEMLDRVVAADARAQAITFTGDELSEWIAEDVAERYVDMS